MPLRSVQLIALELEAETHIVLQRVPRSTTAEHVADELTDAVVAEQVFHDAQTVQVVDTRQWTADRFADWDVRRQELIDGPRLVILLDAASGERLLKTAPQTASWAGGVRLPAERDVRPAESDDEKAAGRETLERLCRERPELVSEYRHQTIGVNLSDGRLFTPTLSESALSRARSELDEGIIFLSRFH